MSRSTSSEDRDQLDTVVVHARREALVILVAFAVCLVWSIGWSYLAGYGEPVDGRLATVLGMPAVDAGQARRSIAATRQSPDWFRRIQELEREVQALREQVRDNGRR